MLQPRDQWAEWLLHRRFGGDPEELATTLQFLESIRDRVLENAAIEQGNKVLDLGTGDGLIAFGALERLNGSGTVIFSDVSADLLDHSRSLGEEMGITGQCRFVEAAAEDLSAIQEESVDVVTARSVLIYVDDKKRAFNEVHRVLRSGGRMSIYEPINRISLPRSPDEFTGGFDVAPVREIAAKVRAVFENAQPSGVDSMLNFDERDLLRWLDEIGFSQIEMDYEVRIGPVPPMKWETYLNTAFNPRMPTLDEAMDQALTDVEREQFSEYLKPLVERGERRFRLGTVYLRAVK